MKQQNFQPHTAGVPARHTATTIPLVGEIGLRVNVDHRHPTGGLQRAEHGGPSESRYVRIPELRTLVPFSVATIWRKSRDGSFPAPIKLSTRISAWNRAEVMAFLTAKEAA